MQRNALTNVSFSCRLIALTLLVSFPVVGSQAEDTNPGAKKWSTDPATLKILTAPDLFSKPLEELVKTVAYKQALIKTPNECPKMLVEAYLSYKYRTLRGKYKATLAIAIGAPIIAWASLFYMGKYLILTVFEAGTKEEAIAGFISYFYIWGVDLKLLNLLGDLKRIIIVKGTFLLPMVLPSPDKITAVFRNAPLYLRRDMNPDDVNIEELNIITWLFMSTLTFLIFKTLLGTPSYLFPILVVRRDIAFVLIMLHYFVTNFKEKIAKPLRAIFKHEYEEEDPSIEEIELMYARNWDRLRDWKKYGNSDMNKLIEEKIFELRRHPDKKKLITKAFVENVIGLPTPFEINVRMTPPEEIDFDEFEDYGEAIKIAMRRLVYRYYGNIPTFPTYLLSPPGWGKNRSITLLANKLGGRIAILQLTKGVTLEELIGRPPAGDDPGDIGLLAKAMIQAGPGPMILFIDELDKVVRGEHRHEMIDFILKHFDGINRTYKCPYLEGNEIYLPSIVIFAGNSSLDISEDAMAKDALSHRTRIVELERYSWEKQVKIAQKTLQRLIEENLQLPYTPLTEKQLSEWKEALEPLRKAQEGLPEKEKNGSIRPLLKASVLYLVRMYYKDEIEKVRRRMDTD
ncbi:MAG: AAA family ATPase [Bacteroidota bacterium]